MSECNSRVLVLIEFHIQAISCKGEIFLCLYLML